MKCQTIKLIEYTDQKDLVIREKPLSLGGHLRTDKIQGELHIVNILK